jgi:hypothetical protein
VAKPLQLRRPGRLSCVPSVETACAEARACGLCRPPRWIPAKSQAASIREISSRTAQEQAIYSAALKAIMRKLASGVPHGAAGKHVLVHARTIASRDRPEVDVQAVPRVDVGYSQRQIDQLLLAEMAFHTLVHAIRNVSVGNARDSFGPLERCALTLVEERRFAPSIERVQSLLSFTFRA